MPEDEIRIGAPSHPWPRRRLENLRRALEACPGVAFAHLPEVFVPGRQERPHPVLFVWLTADALGAMRRSLQRVYRAVASALPDGEYVDVVLLNSAPELLAEVEAAGCLLAEPVPEERRRALAAAASPPETAAGEEDGPPWWAFWRR